MGFAEIHTTMRASMQNAVEQALDIQPFSFSLEPPKSRNDGGLGLQNDTWWGFLDLFKDSYLPAGPPYSGLAIDSNVADATFAQDLATTCYQFAQSIA